MSLLVVSLLNDSIIMGSDSRTTYKYSDRVEYVDAAYKTTLMDGRIGISHCRNASLFGKRIEEYLEDFAKKYSGRSITRIPRLLKEYFLNIKSDCDIAFFVAGYENDKPRVYRIHTKGSIETCNTNVPQVWWEGERDVASRLFSPNLYFTVGARYEKHSHYKLAIDKFSIKEGVEFTNFLIETAGKTLYFQEADKTIGGPIDILILKRNGLSYWHQRK